MRRKKTTKTVVDTSLSEASSLLINEDCISEALRTYDQTQVWDSSRPLSGVQTTRTLPTPLPTRTGRPPVSRQKIQLQRSDRDKEQKGLMLSPRPPSAVSRLSIVHPGLDPHPILIHSRDRRALFTATLKLQPVLTTRRHLSVYESDRPKAGDFKYAALLASKGERVITMSKSSRLLRAFAL